MDKRKIFTAIMAISMLITTFSGCSSNQKQSYGNLGKGDESDRPEVEDIVIDNESDIYNIGDEIQVKNVDYGTNREYVAKSYIVNSVKIYDTAAEIDGVQDKLIETDYYMGADPEKPAILKKDEVACGKLLLCDISVKNIEDEICTVGDISLVYDINGVCQLLGYPVQGQSLDAQIGFCVDPALLQIDNMDLNKLYLSVNFNGDEENRQFIDPGLE